MSLFQELKHCTSHPKLSRRLEALCDDFERKNLSRSGRFLLKQSLKRTAASAERTASWLTHSPEVKLKRPPVIIIGLQRTGTTFLQHLLSSLSEFDSLKLWQLMELSPEISPLRKKISARALVQIDRLIHPGSEVLHPMTWNSPEECWWIFNQFLGSIIHYLHYDLDQYWDSIHQPDEQADIYGSYARVLGRLSGGSEKPLVMKCPDHLWQIESLLTAIPDARLIWCHRDPKQSVASFCSMISMHQKRLFESVDSVGVGNHVLELFKNGVEHADRTLKAHPNARVLHVKYSDLTRDPFSTASEVFKYLELDATNDLQSRVTGFLKNQHRSKTSHDYSLEKFGLNPRRVDEAFQSYSKNQRHS